MSRGPRQLDVKGVHRFLYCWCLLGWLDSFLGHVPDLFTWLSHCCTLDICPQDIWFLSPSLPAFPSLLPHLSLSPFFYICDLKFPQVLAHLLFNESSFYPSIIPSIFLLSLSLFSSPPSLLPLPPFHFTMSNKNKGSCNICTLHWHCL